MAVSTYFITVTVAVVFFVATLTPASSLTCYYCNRNGEKCDNTTALITEVCGTNSSNKNILEDLGIKSVEEKKDSAWACAKVVSMNKESYVYNTYKACVREEINDQDFCDAAKESMKLNGYNTESCDTCSDNLCNAAAGLTQNTLISSIILLPILYKIFV